MMTAEKQYRYWLYTAILRIRKAANGCVPYAEVVPALSKDTAFSYMQWAAAAGYLSRSGEYIYEARHTRGMSNTEIYAELNYTKEPTTNQH